MSKPKIVVLNCYCSMKNKSEFFLLVVQLLNRFSPKIVTNGYNEVKSFKKSYILLIDASEIISAHGH